MKSSEGHVVMPGNVFHVAALCEEGVHITDFGILHNS